MRSIVTFENIEKADRFSLFLLENGIENQVDSKAQNQFVVWVLEEDDLERSKKCLDEFSRAKDWKPSAQALQKKREAALEKEIEAAMKESSFSKDEEAFPDEKKDEMPEPQEAAPQEEVRARSSFGKVTISIMAACIMLFLWASFSSPSKIQVPEGEVTSSFFFTPPYSDLIYEYPLAYQYASEFLENLRHSENQEEYLKSQAAFEEMYRFQSTPYWHGYYETVFLPSSAASYSLNKMYSKNPQFEQIASGEVWRIFTPALLHANLFHILFNLLWFAFLGRQIEERVGFWRYSLFILLAAAVSNTAQYLMSGPNFLGISGVVMAMAGFIWMRQSKAAWEGYTIQKPTLYFLGFYVLVLVALQTISFVLELSGYKGIAPNIANTAHVIGACVGIFFGRLHFMSAWHLNKIKK